MLLSQGSVYRQSLCSVHGSPCLPLLNGHCIPCLQHVWIPQEWPCLAFDLFNAILWWWKQTFEVSNFDKRGTNGRTLLPTLLWAESFCVNEGKGAPGGRIQNIRGMEEGASSVFVQRDKGTHSLLRGSPASRFQSHGQGTLEPTSQ